ncbi:MAG: phosphotransferase [Xanthomonadaceae bacterium]|nr:phosphotransferase [Xanthomonadaceae bacterium]MDE1885261.1 phosphotransferase [Xanthomonadaceae bacterium]MDE1961801.1 phosphotransferase [Xanthomonadaceae bacterium]MDE2085484.1 phosphotransferase [Xanthomonadaceae bacterium]MDE2257978.1 phosphotransferase [Xanthomonadaceae bacterium]
MLDKTHWQDLIPHCGAMCLLDAVIEWDDEHVHALARSHRDAHNPLRAGGCLHAVNLCEYGAQAMAVHGGLLAQRDGKTAVPGMLVSLREVKLHVTRIDDLPGDLEIHAQRLLLGFAAMQYVFRIEHAGKMLAAGRAAVMTKESS